MKKIFFFALILLVTGCIKPDLVLFVQQPSYEQLNNSNLIVFLDDKEIYNDNLSYSNVASTFDQVLSMLENGKHRLSVLLESETFEFDIDFPKDKFIIVSPHMYKGKVNVNILKSDKNFEFY